MRTVHTGCSCLTLVGLLLAAGCATTHNTPAVPPDASLRVLQESGTFIGAQPAFAYRATGYLDVRQDDGSLLQTVETFDVYIQRPDKLRIDAFLSNRSVKLWYQAGEVVMLDENAGKAARASLPPTIDAFLDLLATKYHTSFPGQDLLRSRPADTLQARVTSGTYLGLESIGAESQHHILLMQGSAAYEIWVDAGARPLVHRFRLVELNKPGRPRYEVDFTNWSTDPIAASVFTPVLPDGTATVAMESLTRVLEVQP